jgi:hypothetical protein
MAMRLLIGLLGVAWQRAGAEVRVVAPVYLDDINDFAKMKRAQYSPEIQAGPDNGGTVAAAPGSRSRVKGDANP